MSSAASYRAPKTIEGATESAIDGAPRRQPRGKALLRSSMLNSPPRQVGVRPPILMTLPQAAVERQLKHRRQIDVQVYARGNGLWEVDALLSDVKAHDVQLAEGRRAAGTPIHEMLLRLVVNEQLDIVEAGSETRRMPFAGRCDAHGDAYARLAGLNLLRNFRRELQVRVGGVLGCTHITELAQTLPTAVVQAFAGEVIDIHGAEEGADKPFQIDRCHALASSGEVVRLHHPRWHRPAATDSD